MDQPAEDGARTLMALVAGLASGRIRIIDLTQTLSPDTPPIVLPPELGQSWPFRREEISRYDERGPSWYWNNISCGEHTGTHFDAPIHWISGSNLPNNTVETVPVEHLIAPAAVIDCAKEAADGCRFPAHARIHRGLGGAPWPHPAPRLAADADRLVEAHRSDRVPEFRRYRPAFARSLGRGGALPHRRARRASASAARRSAPMPARRSI